MEKIDTVTSLSFLVIFMAILKIIIGFEGSYPAISAIMDFTTIYLVSYIWYLFMIKDNGR